MKVLILTNPEHMNFVWDVVKQYKNSITVMPHEFYDVDYDIGISFMYQKRVPKSELDTHIWINFHPAPLPEYKGRNLCYHAIMNGEKEFGVSVHYMDENFDTGDIIEVFKFALHPWWTSEDVSNKAIDISKKAFEIYFPRIIAGERFIRYPNVGGTYYPRRPIYEEIFVHTDSAKLIRAITYGNFHPKINIGGVTYKIVKDE